MTDTPSFNISRVAPTAPAAPQTNNKTQTSNVRYADKSPNRTISPITKYNNETGLLDVADDSPWGKDITTETNEQTLSKEPTTPAKDADRHSKWKEEQAAKKAQRENARVEKAAKTQSLAKELLRKGDLVGAAKALDMSPADLAAYVDNARLQIPNKTEELTPEQKRQLDDDNWKKERAAFEDEQRQFKYTVIKTNYIKDKISPILDNKEQFELINKADVKKIENYIYDFMDKHYRDTGEELDAKDVAETIETQLYDSYVASLEGLRGVKKVAKFFSPQQEAQQEDDLADTVMRDIQTPNDRFKEPTIANKIARPLDSRYPLRDNTEDLIKEAEAEEAKLNQPPVVRKTETGRRAPFALLSREERLALMNSER